MALLMGTLRRGVYIKQYTILDLRALARWSYRISPVSLLVGWLPPYLENGSNDFLQTLQLFRDRYSKKTDRALFLKKNLVSYKKIQTCIFRCFFDHFSLNMLTILLKSSEMVEKALKNTRLNFFIRNQIFFQKKGSVSLLRISIPK